jgi:hypothetical protein
MHDEYFNFEKSGMLQQSQRCLIWWLQKNLLVLRRPWLLQPKRRPWRRK